MPLPSGPLMTAPETQAGVSKKVQQAMQDLALKGEMQRQAKAEAQVKAAKDAVAAAEAVRLAARPGAALAYVCCRPRWRRSAWRGLRG
jgi:hypothetical protein